MIYPKLYKRYESGSIRVWWAEAYKEDTKADVAKYRYHSGKLDGKIVTSEWTRVVGKNVGRSNETKAYDQAHKEIQAMYEKKQKRSDYRKTIETVDNIARVKPMLAHKYEDHKHKLKYPVYIQPKLDGIRCIATPEGLFTRKGERISSCPHIEREIKKYVEQYNLKFDGELYNHELKDDFNEIQSLVTRKHIDERQETKIERYVQYHIYDVISDAPFRKRFKFLQALSKALLKSSPLVIVPTKIITEPEYLDDAYDEFLNDGYEGQMIRANVPYEPKRTAALLKRKEFQDAEFKILSIHEGKGNRSGMAGYAILDLGRTVTMDGGRLGTFKTKTFNAAFMGTNEYRKKLLIDKDKYVGKLATVKFFRLTPAGVPRFPVIKAIRVKGF